ncbi:MAG: hypothetical protein HY289_00270 [Planctomycetes bacterium]|nr:hypothetical protein [Planctomycetota bacterium]
MIAVRKLMLALLGVMVVSSLAYGGWRLWSAPEDDVPAPVAVDSQPANKEPVKAPPAKDEGVVVTPPVVEPPVVAQEPAKKEQPNLDEPRKKESLKGKNHERPSEMLTTMAGMLHHEAYQHFINQPGMGVRRMMPLITVMPREWNTVEWSSEELSKEQPPVWGQKDLESIHKLSIFSFGESNTKSPEQRWQALYNKPLPRKAQLWEIKSLDLVGLVVHDEPVVYVSELETKKNGPMPKFDMTNLKENKKRDLDLFEAEGLEELRNGKPLYIRSKEGIVRVLGPINAGKACLKCHHESKEGDMLGAFSYTLRVGQYRMEDFNRQPIPSGPKGPKTPPSK